MSKSFFIVGATVADPAKRVAFDAGCGKKHLPDTTETFAAQKASRFWG